MYIHWRVDLTNESPRVFTMLRDGNLGSARLLFLQQKGKPTEDEQVGRPSFILQGHKHADYSTGAIFEEILPAHLRDVVSSELTFQAFPQPLQSFQ